MAKYESMGLWECKQCGGREIAYANLEQGKRRCTRCKASPLRLIRKAKVKVERRYSELGR